MKAEITLQEKEISQAVQDYLAGHGWKCGSVAFQHYGGDTPMDVPRTTATCSIEPITPEVRRQEVIAKHSYGKGT